MSRISSFLGIDFVDRLAKGEVGSAPGPYQTCVAALAYAWTRQRYSGSRPMAVIGQSSGVWAAAALMGAIWIEDARKLLMLRGELIAEASARHGEGRMLSVVGPDPADCAWPGGQITALHRLAACGRVELVDTPTEPVASHYDSGPLIACETLPVQARLFERLGLGEPVVVQQAHGRGLVTVAVAGRHLARHRAVVRSGLEQLESRGSRPALHRRLPIGFDPPAQRRHRAEPGNQGSRHSRQARGAACR